MVQVKTPPQWDEGGVPAVDDKVLVWDESEDVMKHYVLNRLLAPAYYVDASEADQGDVSVDADKTFKDLVDLISTNNATIVLTNHGAASTTYPFGTAEVSPANVFIKIQPGALISGTLEIYSSANIIASSGQQIFASGATITFTVGGVFHPEWWGAKGDGSTNDYTALTAAIAVCRTADSSIYYTTPTLSLRPHAVYVTETGLFFGSSSSNTGVRRVVGNKSTIHGKNTTLAVVDWTGTHVKEMEGVTIYGDDTVTPPIGLLLSRRTHQVGGGRSTFINVNIEGKFSDHGVYNYGSEEDHWIDCAFEANVPHLLVVTQDDTTYSEYAAGNIPNSDGTLALESNTDHYFTRCRFFNRAVSGTAVNCLELLSPKSTVITSCIFHDSPNNIKILKIAQENQQSHSISILDSLFHAAHDSAIYLGGTIRNLTVRGNRWGTLTHTLDFTSGGTHELVVGDTIEGETGGATGYIVAINLSSGTWAGGDAAGTFYLTSKTGTFEAETVKDNGNLDCASIAGDSTPTSHIEGAANLNIFDSHLEAGKIDFSAANCDVNDSSFIKIQDGDDGFLSISSQADGIIMYPHDASVTLSGTRGSDVTCTEVVTGTAPLVRDNAFADYHKFAADATAGTGEDDLTSITLRANTLVPKSSIRISGAGSIANANGNKTIKLHIGSASHTIVPAENLADGTEWVFDFVVSQTNTTGQQRGRGVCYVGESGGGYSIKYVKGSIGPNQDETAAIIIKVTGECAHADDTITQRNMAIEVL